MESLAGTEAKAESETIFENLSNIEVEELDKKINMDELNAAIKEMKTQKACGDDKVFSESILNASFGIKYLILVIFNNILTLEHFPSIWGVGSIVPIFKAGEPSDPSN